MIHLTGHNYTPKEIVQNVFSPLIAVVCSAQASELCQKNNLTFVELLQPFCRLTSDAHFRDSSGTSVSIKGLRLNVCDVDWRPPQTVLARKMLNESVAAHCQSEATKRIVVNETLVLEVPETQPWFEQWRETFFTVQFPADHEFTRHYVACMIVISSSDPNPLDSANQLTQKVYMMQNVTPPKLPKWISNDVLNCYVMLHDGCSGDISKTQQVFDAIKSTFGENRCFLVQINSSVTPQSESADLWHKYLKRVQKPADGVTMDHDSTPRTPQEIGNIPISIVQGGSPGQLTGESSQLETPPSGIVPAVEVVVAHPLSPITETGQDLLQNPIMSSSTESLSSQLLNPNVWTTEMSEAEIAYGSYLTTGDIDNLRHLIQDFTIRALVPYVEKLVGVLNEGIATKKGVSRSLLSATKRWFVTNKPGAATSGQNAVVYTADATELQTRKLGDLYFMFGNYNLAFQAYHQAKRDFNADSAWQYYAGALEMAALSAFMLGTANRKTYDYMEEAIVTYLNICKLPQFATRTTLLSLECLKASKMHSEACRQLTRMTSEDSDLRSALLLEQAAYCHLNGTTPYFRKYAFHLVLAAHRFGRSGQRKHSYRAHKQALQVYERKEWNLAVDHVLHTVGKQAMSLKKVDEASALFAPLLRPSIWVSAEQQLMFLKDYIGAQKALLGTGEPAELLDLALPVIEQSSVRVLVTSPPPVANPLFVPASNIHINDSQNDEARWNKLEEMVVQSASSKPIMVFKPLRSLFSREVPGIEHPLAVHGEPIEISFVLENSIKPAILFEEIDLLWQFTKETDEKVENSALFKSDLPANDRKSLDDLVATQPIKQIHFGEYEKKLVTIKATAKAIGLLRIVGVVGKLSCPNDTGTLWGKLRFESRMVKINDKRSDFDKKLEIHVLPPAPALHVSFSQTPDEVLAGEVVPVMINLTNAGTSPIGDIYVGIDTPRWISVNPEEAEVPLSVQKELRDMTHETLSRDRETRKQYVFKLFKTSEPSVIRPKETKTSSIWMQAPYKKGSKEIRFLIYYEMPSDYPKLKYRLVRHIWTMNVHESLLVEAQCNLTNRAKKEIGIDLTVKNLNQVHHALMTDILVSEVNLFSSTHAIEPSRTIYLKSPSYQRIIVESDTVGLKSNESFSMRLALDRKLSAPAKSSPSDHIVSKLSETIVRNVREARHQLPDLQTTGSFLMKHETRFLDVFQQSTSAEEFSHMVSRPDPHMTLCVTWKAAVYDSSSLQRNTFGQHFVQMRHLFETIFCPPKERLQHASFVHEDLISVSNFEERLDNLESQEDKEADDWAVHNVIVSRRCFIEKDVQWKEDEASEDNHQKTTKVC